MTDGDARLLVRAVLTEMGIDVSDPNEMQADFVFLRRQRIATERLGLGARVTLVSLFLTGLGSLIWLGVRAAINPGD